MEGSIFEQRRSILEKLKRRVQQLKKKRPGYGEILDFYQKVKEAQDKVKASLKIDPIKLKKEWRDLLAKEGFSLIQREDFPLDMEVTMKLFQSLSQIGKTSNPHMAEQVEKINEAIDSKKIDLKKLLKMGVKEQKIEQVAAKFGLDKKVFSFLVRNSIKPSIEAGMEQLSSELDSESWLKGYCPVCGSLPHLSLLREEVGKRYLICSFCGYSWRIDRLICPFCNNKEQEFLQYFYGEGEETYRINLCNKCHQYIKTIDLRILGESDPSLEDLATLHLDILAFQKGYKRPVPNPWTI
jgi:FdhE protein